MRPQGLLEQVPVDSVTSNNRNASSHGSGGQESKVKVWAGPCSRCRSTPSASGGSGDRWLVAAPIQPPPVFTWSPPLCLPLCPLLFLEGHLSLD